MKAIHWLLVGMLATVVSGGEIPSPTTVAETNYQDTNGFYVIEFRYCTEWQMTPATYPASPPHYDATITVFEVKAGKRVKVGESFQGYYTGGKCWEDNPADLVARAKRTVKK